MNYLLVALLVVPVVAVACPSGTESYKDTCIDSAASPEVGAAVKPSDEKPPVDKMPSYQREGVVIVSPPNMAMDDEKADAEKRRADADGKKAAGIK